MKDLNLKQYDQAKELLKDLDARVEAGEIMSIIYVAETPDGGMFGGCTSTENVFAVGGYMLAWALIRMGFVKEQIS